MRVQVSPSAHNCNFFALNTYFSCVYALVDKHVGMDFFKKILSVYFYFIHSLVFSQEEAESQKSDSEESDDTSAESAITGSVASVQTAPSGAIESNPLVLLVRSGSVSLSDALSLGLAGCLELQSSLGNLDVSDDVFAAALAVRA